MTLLYKSDTKNVAFFVQINVLIINELAKLLISISTYRVVY